MEDSFDEVDWFRIAIYIAVSGLMIWLGNHYYPDVKWFFPPAVVLIAGFFFLQQIGKGVIWKSRYSSYSVNVNGCHGSIYGKPEYIKDVVMTKEGDRKTFVWAVFNLGHSTFPISLRGKIATLVVPANQLYPVGKGFTGLTLVQKWPLGSLPPNVHRFLRNNSNDFNMENIFFGGFSQEYIDNSSEQADLKEQIIAKDILIGVLQKTIEHDFGNFEEIKEFSDRMSSNPTMIKKMISKVKNISKEED